MRWDVLTFAAGVIAASLAGFFCPFWYLGFVPLAGGLLWSAYDFVEVTGGDTASTPQG